MVPRKSIYVHQVSLGLPGEVWNMIEFHNLCKRFHAITALGDVSFRIETGTAHALVGENGAGKSTLMKILGGAYVPDEGEIRIDGVPVHFNSPADSIAAGVGIIHQELNLIPYLSVAENIMLGNEPLTPWRTIDQKASRERASQLLAMLGLHVNPARLVGSLRVGEQQLVEIAKALAANVRILVLDEPTSALSTSEIDNLMHVMENLRANGVTLIYISHKLDEVFRIADAITVLRDGHHVGTWPSSELTEHDVITHMVGRELNDLFPKTHVEPGEVVLKVTNLSTHPGRFEDRREIRDVSFTLRRGEILGLAGLLGAGRTETLEAIYGSIPRSKRTGSIELRGQSTVISGPNHAIKSGIAMVPEDRKNQSIVPSMTVRENATLSHLTSLTRIGVVNQRRERDVTREEMESLSIKAPGQTASINALSGGNQQKVVLARCLLNKPDVLLLDEPTRGIDVGAKSEIYALMSQIAAQGTAIVMASSELPELLAMCDRILVMHEGRVVHELDAEHASQTSVMAAATGQIDLLIPQA